MVWPIITLHWYYDYFGQDHVKDHCQKENLEIMEG
jgi:hypothetical protein